VSLTKAVSIASPAQFGQKIGSLDRLRMVSDSIREREIPMQSAFALMSLEVELIETCHSMDSPTQVGACDTAVVVSDTI